MFAQHTSTDDSSSDFTITKVGERNSVKFKTTCMVFKLDFGNEFEAFTGIPRAMDELIQEAFSNAPPRAKVGLTIDHPDLKRGIAIIPFTRKEDLSVGKVLTFIEKLSQSNHEIPLTSFNVEAVIINIP